MRILIASPLGFLIGLSLGALGGGGSILAVPVLVYAAGQSVRGATSTSLVLVGLAAAVGMVAHHRAGRVRWRLGLAFGAAGLGGSIGGSALNRHLDPHLLLLAFSGLVLVAAWRMATACPGCTRHGEELAMAGEAASADGSGGVAAAPAGGAPATAVAHRAAVVTAGLVLLTGTGIGFMTGLFGVGGGFVIVPALALFLGMTMAEAVGTSLLVIAMNSAEALAARLPTASLDWAVALPFSAAAVAGVLAGKKIADRVDTRSSLRWFAGLLVAVGAYTAVRAAVALA